MFYSTSSIRGIKFAIETITNYISNNIYKLLCMNIAYLQVFLKVNINYFITIP